MRKRVMFIICIGLALLSACIPAGKTLEDYKPRASELPARTPEQLSARVVPPARTSPLSVPVPAPLLPVDAPAPEPEANSVAFADPAFEKAVRAYLGREQGAITPADIKSITRLGVTTLPLSADYIELDDSICIVYEAASLEDLPLFESVDTLLLDQFQQFSLKPAATLPLTWLELWNCVDIADWDALSKGAGADIASIGIYQCTQFEDITPLAGFNGLTSLDIINTRVSDLSPLSSLSGLFNLDLYGNRIRDISPIAPLFRLQYLDVSNNFVTDLSPLSGMGALKVLRASNNRVVSLEPLKALKLSTLYLDKNEITNISPLAQQAALDELDLSHNPLKSLYILPRLSALSEVGVEGIAPKYLDSLLRVPNLTFALIDPDQAAVWQARLEQKEIRVEISEPEATPAEATPTDAAPADAT